MNDLFAVAAIAAIGVFLWWAWRRPDAAPRLAGLLAQPGRWPEVLAPRVRLYARLPVELREPLAERVTTFLRRVAFIGCNGLVVTDEMRLQVATQACLLIVRRDPRSYDSLYSVLLYPDEFLVEERDEDEAGVVTEGVRPLSGQTLDTDRIVLSWRDVLEAERRDDGYNVVLHEFAHFLDHVSAGALSGDGRVPAAARDDAAQPGSANAWHRILDREYEALCDDVDRGEETLIDPYGAEDPVEFFAVSTETFFGVATEMRRRHPALYAALQGFYGIDPANWDEAPQRA